MNPTVNDERPIRLSINPSNQRQVDEAPVRELLDIIVETADGNRYYVVFATPRRMSQEMDLLVKQGIIWIADSGLILVPDLELPTLNLALRAAWKERFFEDMSPITDESDPRLIRIS